MTILLFYIQKEARSDFGYIQGIIEKIQLLLLGVLRQEGGPVGIYLLKVNDAKRRSGVFIVNFEHI